MGGAGGGKEEVGGGGGWLGGCWNHERQEKVAMQTSC